MEKGRKGQNCDGFNQDLNQGYWSGTCRDSAASRGHWEKMIFQLFVLSVHYCVHSIIPNVYIQMMSQKRSPKIQEYVNAHTCLIFGTKLNNGFVLVINAAVNIKAQWSEEHIFSYWENYWRRGKKGSFYLPKDQMIKLTHFSIMSQHCLKLCDHLCFPIF